MKLAHFPSISACIINDNRVTWSKEYGFYDIENRKPTTTNTIYNVASISKTITGTALMQLYDKGLFDLDEDVNNYLSFNLRNPHFPDDPITFRMLLAHSSSLESESSYSMKYYQWYNFSADPPFSFYPNPWLEEHLIPGGKWYYSGRWSNDNPPGDYAMYSNVNFDIIAYLVEIISGESFLKYCKKYIFEPLEMYSTSFNLSELDIEKVAIPYHYHEGRYNLINEANYLYGDYTPPEKYWRKFHYPVAGLYTTVSDLSHFLIAHMNDGVWNGVRILEKETVEEMHRIQPPGNTYGNINFGLAWKIQQNPLIFKINFSGHDGGTLGVFTFMNYIPSEKIGVIYFVNADTKYEENEDLRFLANDLITIFLLKKGGLILFPFPF